MIYLIQSYYTDKQDHPRKCLKIGYAKNIEDRMKAYKTHNPSIQLLKTREGEYDLENFLHKYFNKYKLLDFNEWFVYKKEIIDKFDVLDPHNETITREEYLEYIRKEIITSTIPETYRDLRSQIPDLLDELKQEFDGNYDSIYSSLYMKFPEWECKWIIIKTLKFLREAEINYFMDCSFSDTINEFPEKISRQRLKENVFRDECIFIYDKLSDKDLIADSFEILRDRKLQITNEYIKNFEIVRTSNPGGVKEYSELIRLESKINKYTESYTGVDEKSGTVIINKLVMLSEKRAFELRSNVYKSEENTYNEFGLIPSLSINSSPILSELEADIEIEREGKVNDPKSLIFEAFKEAFVIKRRYTLKYIKNRVSEIYKKLGLTKAPKASDLEEFFEVKRCTIIDSGKRVNGYEILKIKE